MGRTNIRYSEVAPERIRRSGDTESAIPRENSTFVLQFVSHYSIALAQSIMGSIGFHGSLFSQIRGVWTIFGASRAA